MAIDLLFGFGLHELLDDAILKRMKADHSQLPAGAQGAFRRRQPRDQLAEFVIHPDTDGLKGPGRGVAVARLGTRQAALNDVGQLAGAAQRARGDDGAGDAA